MRKNIIVSIIACVLTFVVLVSCSSQPNNTNVSDTNKDKEVKQGEMQKTYDGGEGRITVYMSGPEQMVKQLEAKFEEKRGDVINLYHTGCGPLRQKVWTEMEAGSIQADVVWGSDPLMYLALKEKGMLRQYNSPQLKALKDEYKLGDGYFSLANARYAIIVYNKDRINESDIPKTWADLKDKKWDGRLVIADATQSSTALAITAGLCQINDNDFKYQKALKENNIVLIKKNSDVAAKVDTGEFDAGILPHDGVIRLIKKAKKTGVDSSLAIAWPEEGALSLQRPIAIIKNKDRSEVNEKLCEEFVDFILSKQAQNISSKFGFITVRKDAELPQEVPEKVKAVTIDWGYACEHENELRENFKDIMFRN